jgi:uncharacterized membrane protein YccC
MDNPTVWRPVRDWVRAHRAQLRFCLRTTVAGLVALAITDVFAFPFHGLWTILTAIVVTQVSIGGSLRATIEYMIGTIGGAIYAAALGVLVPHTTAAQQALALALAIAPLALAAAVNPSFRVAPFSAVLVLLLGADIGESPIQAAVTRVLEVALGGGVAVAVSVLVLPERAHRLGLEAAVRILNHMADVLPKLLSGFTQNLDAAEIRRLQDDLGRLVTGFQEITAEARRERVVPFTRAPDPAPLSRTLLRLRHDLVILGRAAAAPLPGAIAQRLAPLLTHVGEGASAFLFASAIALTQGRPPPPLEPVAAALQAYVSEVAALRSEGLTRALSTDELERLFALGFALEQLRHDLSDLARCVRELAEAPAEEAGHERDIDHKQSHE